MIKKENFITIQGWMVSELGLKGNALMVYAIIYGFSQTEGQVFTGSLQYLADWTNSTKRSIIEVLKKLVDDDLLGKNEKIVNGVKFCEYYTLKFTGSEKSSVGVVKKVHHGSEKSSPNNIIDNIKDNIDTTNTKVLVAAEPQEFGNKEINDLFRIWEDKLGFKVDTKVKQNRYACQRLLKSRGFENIVKVLDVLAEAQQDQYAPTIYNFMDLADKWNNLGVWYHKKLITKKKKGVVIVGPNSTGTIF